MGNFETGGFDFWRDPEVREVSGRREREPSNEADEVDLRHESEVFQDHERIDNSKDIDDQLVQLRDQLSEDSDGIIRIVIPAYEYDFRDNPFVGMGPRRVKTYEISRYIDVVFLHRFMYQDIIVCGVQSRAFAKEAQRAAFIKRVREMGGLPVNDGNPPDILGREFVPYSPYHTTDAFFRLYHTTMPRAAKRPHWPLDLWLIFDQHAYRAVDGSLDFRQAYRLRKGFSRRASLLGVAQIN
mgnify:FL=1